MKVQNHKQPAENAEQNTEDASSAERASILLVHNSDLLIRTGSPAETEITDESGRSKRKRIPRQMNLNGCLCGTIVKQSTAVVPVIECNRKGCETQWVSTTLQYFYCTN